MIKKNKEKLMKGKKVICNNLVYCNNVVSKGTGLMFRTEKSLEDTAWIFSFKKSRKISLTMIFVFFPIDVIFLNGNKEIVEIVTLYPWQSYFPKKKANYCIELKKGTANALGLNICDKLTFP